MRHAPSETGTVKPQRQHTQAANGIMHLQGPADQAPLILMSAWEGELNACWNCPWNHPASLLSAKIKSVLKIEGLVTECDGGEEEWIGCGLFCRVDDRGQAGYRLYMPRSAA